MSDLVSTAGDFAKGFGQGLWGGATELVHGIGSLAEGGYALATDSNARQQAWNSAVSAAQTAEWAAKNPGQAAQAIGHGANAVYGNFVKAEQQAEANGTAAQFWGNIVGQGTFAVGTVLVPGLAEAKLAGAAGEVGELAEGAGAIGRAAAVTDDGAGTSFLLRGDTRPPSNIFESGFQPKGGAGANVSLRDYVLNNTPSKYVGMTTDPDIAAEFATQGGASDGFVYATDRLANGITVNDTFPNNPFAREQEIAVPGGLNGTQVRGATAIDADGTLADHSVLNPNYTGGGANPEIGATAPPPSGASVVNGSSVGGATVLGAGYLGNATIPATSDREADSAASNGAAF